MNVLKQHVPGVRASPEMSELHQLCQNIGVTDLLEEKVPCSLDTGAGLDMAKAWRWSRSNQFISLAT